VVSVTEMTSLPLAVLREMAPDIARELIVSLNTMRTHTKSI
jgi:hypothetical protein